MLLPDCWDVWFVGVGHRMCPRSGLGSRKQGCLADSLDTHLFLQLCSLFLSKALGFSFSSSLTSHNCLHLLQCTCCASTELAGDRKRRVCASFSSDATPLHHFSLFSHPQQNVFPVSSRPLPFLKPLLVFCLTDPFEHPSLYPHLLSSKHSTSI